MTSDSEQKIADEIISLLIDTIMLRNPPQVPEHLASVESLQMLYENLVSLRDFLYLASNGNFSKTVLIKGFLGGTLKTLQANLRHMTWQTKMIASGDFTQRVEFMGEFSESFNEMVVQLHQAQSDLINKQAELAKANRDLKKEIAIRKQVEKNLQNSENELRLLATTDSLTGLYNRRHFNKLANNEIGRAVRYSRPLSIMMFDIDHFKKINDTFGHAGGDTVLKAVSTITKETFRSSDIVARYGGEEFLVLLPETTVEQAAISAEKLRKKIESYKTEAGSDIIRVTASFGISDYSENTDSSFPSKILAKFIECADQALYISKKTGRNKVSIFESSGVS